MVPPSASSSAMRMPHSSLTRQNNAHLVIGVCTLIHEVGALAAVPGAAGLVGARARRAGRVQEAGAACTGRLE